MGMSGGFIYILQSLSTSRYYIGSSGDIGKRLIHHNQGKVIATRNRGPWVLKYSQFYPTAKQARQMEYRLKQMKSRVIIDKITKEQIIRSTNVGV